MIIKSKLSSNLIYQGSASEMILIQFLPSLISYEPDERDYRLQRIKRKEKRRRLGEDLEMQNITAGNWKEKEKLIYQKNV